MSPRTHWSHGWCDVHRTDMDSKISIRNYSLSYDRDQVLSDVSFEVPRNAITTVFGPAGGGKSGLLRSINRMAELVPGEHHTGDILIDGASIFAPSVNIP